MQMNVCVVQEARSISFHGITCVLEKATHLETLDIASEIRAEIGNRALVEDFHHRLASQTDMKELSLPMALTAVGETRTFCQVSTNLHFVTSFTIFGNSKESSDVPLVSSDLLLAELSKWKHLESLNLSCIPNMRSTLGLVTVAQQCYHLQQLSIKNIGLHGHSSTLASLPQVLKYCSQLEVFSLEQRLFSFSPHFADGLSTCSNLKYCRLCLIDGRVDSESVMRVLKKCRCLMGFALFSAMKIAHCKLLKKQAHSLCGKAVILIIKKEPKEIKEFTPFVEHFLETGNWLDQLGTLY
jgi:hypothetical protein